MPQLLERLQQYKRLILVAIEAAGTPDEIMVCYDFIGLFTERFKPLLKYQEWADIFFDLHEAIESRSNIIKTIPGE